MFPFPPCISRWVMCDRASQIFFRKFHPRNLSQCEKHAREQFYNFLINFFYINCHFKQIPYYIIPYLLHYPIYKICSISKNQLPITISQPTSSTAYRPRRRILCKIVNREFNAVAPRWGEIREKRAAGSNEGRRGKTREKDRGERRLHPVSTWLRSLPRRYLCGVAV